MYVNNSGFIKARRARFCIYFMLMGHLICEPENGSGFSCGHALTRVQHCGAMSDEAREQAGPFCVI
jgi:hypothetical protein